MRLRTIAAITAIAFGAWRSYRGMKEDVRTTAKKSLRRMQKAIG